MSTEAPTTGTATETLTLVRSLRQAAQLVIDLSWTGGVTWGGRDNLSLHPTTKADTRATTSNLQILGATCIGAGVIKTTGQPWSDYQMPNGLKVTVFDPTPTPEAA